MRPYTGQGTNSNGGQMALDSQSGIHRGLRSLREGERVTLSAVHGRR